MPPPPSTTLPKLRIELVQVWWADVATIHSVHWLRLFAVCIAVLWKEWVGQDDRWSKYDSNVFLFLLWDVIIRDPSAAFLVESWRGQDCSSSSWPVARMMPDTSCFMWHASVHVCVHTQTCTHTRVHVCIRSCWTFEDWDQLRTCCDKANDCSDLFVDNCLMIRWSYILQKCFPWPIAQ